MKELRQSLSSSLPKDITYKLLYVQSKPIYVKPLINLKRNHAQDTVKIRHFFNLIDSKSSIILFGIEILVYLVNTGDSIEQYIFIAKCDTVGFVKSHVRVGSIVTTLLQWLIKYDLSRYSLKRKRTSDDKSVPEDNLVGAPVEKQYKYDISQRATLASIKKFTSSLHNDPKFYSTIPYYNPSIERKKVDKKSNQLELPTTQTIKICLFAKAAPQYLFPYSFKNKFKHVVNGSVLLKWWLRVMDEGLEDSNWQCKLIIPGSDVASTQKFLHPLHKKWHEGHVFGGLREQAIYSVPLFPDDPKGRFLEHLVVEDRYQTINNDQFFTELGIRQEFRLGDVVGLVGCELQNQRTETREQDEYEFNVLTIREYKQLMVLLKNENYSVEAEIKSLVDVKVPNFFEKHHLDDVFIDITGTQETSRVKVSKKAVVVNTLSVKRKAKVIPTDLTGLVKRSKA